MPRRPRPPRSVKPRRPGLVSTGELKSMKEFTDDGKLRDDAPVEAIHGVGKMNAASLHANGIHTVKDYNEKHGIASDQPVEKKSPEYAEIEISSNKFKGSGHAWIQRYEDGRRADFVEPWNVEKPDKYKMEKTYRLKPGDYLVNETGSKSQDHRYKIRVREDGTLQKIE